MPSFNSFWRREGPSLNFKKYLHEKICCYSLFAFKNTLCEVSRNGSKGGWIQLPGTAKEITEIKKLFAQNKIDTASFTQQNATEERFKSLSGRSPAVLHLATHGFFLPDPEQKRSEGLSLDDRNVFTLADNPMLRSGVVLSGANRAWEGKAPIEGCDNGIVTECL
jgi:hypothetical protein